jgi:arsenate reductase-like glutaredoxin family protein
MVSSRDSLRVVVQELMNDVIEQGFHHLINHPQESDELNRIIKDATEELNYQLLKVDSHNYKHGSEDLQKHYEMISHDTQRKSLDLLSRLQKIQVQRNPRLKRI